MKKSAALLLAAAAILTSAAILPEAEAHPQWQQNQTPYLRGSVNGNHYGWNNPNNPHYNNRWNTNNWRYGNVYQQANWNNRYDDRYRLPQRYDNINRAQRAYQDRIQNGIRSGALTRQEANHLREAEARIRALEAKYRDGGLTRHERDTLLAAQSRLRRQINQEMRDNQYRR